MLRHHVRGVPSGQFASRCPLRLSCSPWAASARRSALARSAVDANADSVASIRPGSRAVIYCSSQPVAVRVAERDFGGADGYLRCCLRRTTMSRVAAAGQPVRTAYKRRVPYC